MSDKPIALLPCPFCGNDPNWHEDQGVFCMHRKCILFGMIFTDETKWNRRISSSIPRAQIEALIKEMRHIEKVRWNSPEAHTRGWAEGAQHWADRLSALLHPELKGEDNNG